MTNTFSKILFSILLFVVAVGAGLWTVGKKKQVANISISVEASAVEKLLPKPSTETEGQFKGLSEAANEVKDLEQSKIADFTTWANQVLADMPTLEDVEEDTSFSGEGEPQALLEASAEITELYVYVDKNPLLKPAAVEVFKNCAVDQNGIDAIRAYCYAKAVRLNLEQDGEFWDPESVSRRIKTLARDL